MSEPKVAIIPARGGSKRIPRKNIKEFLGEPIIAYSIKAALACRLFDEVMVSTDDAEIAKIAEKYGARVPFLRSSKNSNDLATTVDVINEVLKFYANQGQYFSYGCCIYATAPLILPKHLAEGYQKLIDFKFNTVFPVVNFGYPIWRSLEKGDRDSVKMIWPEYLMSRSQDLRPAFHDAGQWYWFTLESARLHTLFSENSGSIELSEEQVQDIDTSIDWRLAEMKFKLLHDA